MDNSRYLFRGKRLDNGEWITGCLVQNVFVVAESKQDIKYIFNTDKIDYDHFGDFEDDYGYYAVDEKTIGQSTGLYAAKSYRGESEEDRLIWEGDRLLIAIYDDYAIPGEEKIEREYTVTYEDGAYWCDDHYLHHICCGVNCVEDIEIINTIHDEQEGAQC